MVTALAMLKLITTSVNKSGTKAGKEYEQAHQVMYDLLFLQMTGKNKGLDDKMKHVIDFLKSEPEVSVKTSKGETPQVNIKLRRSNVPKTRH
jgi:hypothetical protein